MRVSSLSLLPFLAAAAAVSAASSASVTTSTAAPPQCERAPLHAQPADANYKLGVAGDPDLFLPGELYTVSLQGVDTGEGQTPFVGFTIWAELDQGADTEQGDTTPPAPAHTNQSLGTFQAHDAQAKLHASCAPAVDNATAHTKTEIQLIWSAPSDALETCIRLCAKVGPAQGAPAVLARKLCAAPAAPASHARHPPIVEPCCACDEAKYEVTFEGLWSRNHHPKDFPPESARAHFGDLIGASHTARYRVWQEGRLASAGLRRLADDGATTALEKELKAESDHIRTIIKARGISWQQIASRVGSPSTFAVFRVDPKHHVVSLAAKLAPSPDWFVGVGALELCNANCTWSESTAIPLYPYDAGMDAGVTYTSRRLPTVPAAAVRALRPDWPRDPRSPFYSPAGEMKPFATLRFTRLRLYEKSCDAADVAEEHKADASGGSCHVLPWGPWGTCSVSCGEGRAARQRQYAWPARAYADACRVPLTDYTRCVGPRRHCRAPTEYEPEPASSWGACAVSAWSEWSPCAGCGVRARTRHYLAPRARKRCHRGYRARTELSQAMPCEAGPCHRPAGVLANATNFDWFYVDNPRGECRTTQWGEWSPCSAGCGRGRRVRTRLYLTPQSAIQAAVTARLLHAWSHTYALLKNIQSVQPENVTSTANGSDVERHAQEYIDRCQYTLTMQEALCDGEDTSCFNNTDPETCKLPVSVGHCRGYDERWFHDSTTGLCEPFGYTGCGGNANNFHTKDACQLVCKGNHTNKNGNETEAIESTTKRSKSSVKMTSTGIDNEVMVHDASYV